MKNFKSRLFVTSATLAAIGFMATANPTQANATEYTSSTWTARTADQIKADIQNLESGSKYTFQWGDTLSAIALATDVSVNALVDVNSIGNADMIIAGNAIVLSADHSIVTVEQDSEVKSYDVSSEEAVEVETPVEAVEEVQAAAPVAEPIAAPAVETYVEPAPVAQTAATTYQASYFLYQVVQAEAGPSYQEKLNVASVIMNRVESGIWGGTTIDAVLYASGQFSVVSNGAAAAEAPTADTIQAVNEVLNGYRSTSAQSFRASGDGVTNVFF
ncbi:cell wall hydrolase [Trichococcus collinsii]|uniref:LysM domain-containing protein n=1 Tax=Trichococcus collinsii TaxID=157076 RepID=A0AB37ZYI8_9LACT|nr:cell wall hydrolase [Trichococcus collinsii]CZR08678.1 lysin motif [Trichococcus collinsii]SEA20152.1 LysM domain-containing protein [Trichococcus collinsii]